MPFPILNPVALILLVLAVNPAAAEKVDVLGGISITKKSYRAPANEQPFFGFSEKNKAQLQADEKLLASIEKSGVTKEYAFNVSMMRGWKAFHKGDAAMAGRRFNQAWLINPSHAAVFQAYAVLAATRFNDPDFAEELFKTGARMDNRPPGYMADYGRFLLIQKRPRDALPVLEDAVREMPSNATAWLNLAWARFKSGQRDRACDAADRSYRLKPPPRVAADLKTIVHAAKCGGQT